MPAALLPASSATDAYRREARRLRCRYAGQPARLHRSLKALADVPPAPRDRHGRSPHEAHRAPAAPPLSLPLRAPLELPQGSPVQRFADHLAQHVGGPVLRYSQRLQLLRVARRFGIERFEANLLIAAVLERRRRQPHARPAEPPAREGALLTAATVFVVVQGALGLGAWWALFR